MDALVSQNKNSIALQTDLEKSLMRINANRAVSYAKTNLSEEDVLFMAKVFPKRLRALAWKFFQINEKKLFNDFSACDRRVLTEMIYKKARKEKWRLIFIFSAIPLFGWIIGCLIFYSCKSRQLITSDTYRDDCLFFLSVYEILIKIYGEKTSEIIENECVNFKMTDKQHELNE